jgi:DNA repair protein RecO (recombination protein O)
MFFAGLLPMTESTTGLILRTRPLTETSLIVQWLTPGLGRLSTVAKGARRPKSPLRGKLDLFYLADFSFTRSRRSELHTLREVILRETHAALRREIGRVQQASYGTELIELTTERETPLPEIYALFAGFLKHLSQQPAQPLTVFAFEIKLLNELGQAPDLAESKLSPGAGRILETLSALDWPALSRLKPSVPQIREIGHFLHDFLLFHLGKIPRGRTLAAK